MTSNCCKANTQVGESCCCKTCSDSACVTKQLYGVCRTDLPCAGPTKPAPDFVRIYNNMNMNRANKTSRM